MVSHISAFLGEGVATSGDGIFSWYTDKGEVTLNGTEVQFVDCELDMKTHFAIVGYALTNGFTTGDYFTEK